MTLDKARSNLKSSSLCLSSLLWSWIRTQFLTLAIANLVTAFVLDNTTSPTSIFRSRPDLHAPIIDMKVLRPELVTPGYIFITPYRNRDPGPYIYDNFGELIYSHPGESGSITAHNFHVCQYKGQDHLCFFQGQQSRGFARGHGTILDRNYRVVESVTTSGAATPGDMHEFSITPYSNGKTIIMSTYRPRMYDLTVSPKYRVHWGLGWIVESIFQEVDISTGKIVFEWRSLDHFDPSHSLVYPVTSDTAGDGLNEDSPWDYFHLNSVDKNAAGDYLISARHMSAIYKISGIDGHILWQIGGKTPTFNQTNFHFSFQHHARFVSENGTHTVLSFFNNGSNGAKATNKHSHAYLIVIDHLILTATVIKSWNPPHESGGIRAGSQGCAQMLPNGNVHVGWGEYPQFSEYTHDGATVQYGVLAQRASNVMVYRSGKYNWTGIPLTKPALWTYARDEDAENGMTFYVSWNGATEVKSWNFYVSNSSSGPFHQVSQQPKTSFETSSRHAEVFAWSFAEALDIKGNRLERSEIARTFIPSSTLLPYCDDDGCLSPARVENGDYDTEAADQSSIAFEQLSINRGYNTQEYYAKLRVSDVQRGRQTMPFEKTRGRVDIPSMLLGILFTLSLLGCTSVWYHVMRSRPAIVTPVAYMFGVVQNSMPDFLGLPRSNIYELANQQEWIANEF